MPHYSDEHLKSVLTQTRVIAMVGVSGNPVRPSNFVARYMVYRNFDVIPVNPGCSGREMYGVTFVESLADVPASVDMIDIFRRSEAVPPIVDEALERFANLKTIWMQIGVEHADAAARAEARGVTVVQDRCPKMEYQRLFGELRKAGINTGIISSRLQPMR